MIINFLLIFLNHSLLRIIIIVNQQHKLVVVVGFKKLNCFLLVHIQNTYHNYFLIIYKNGKRQGDQFLTNYLSFRIKVGYSLWIKIYFEINTEL